MKQLLSIALIIGLSMVSAWSAPVSAFEKPDFILIEDQIVLVTVDAYMDASSVSVQLLDASGSVQASATTAAGRTVSFQLNDGSRKVRSTYNRGTLGSIIVEDDLIVM